MFLRLPQNYFARPFAFLLIGEATVFFAAFYLAALIRWGTPEQLNYYLWDGVIFAIACAGSLFAMGLYHGRNSTRFRDVFIKSEEHTSELQSLMRISYAVFCLKKTKYNTATTHTST